jgi:hypothetical protein
MLPRAGKTSNVYRMYLSPRLRAVTQQLVCGPGVDKYECIAISLSGNAQWRR